MNREVVHRLARILRIALYVAVVVTGVLVTGTLVDWFLSEPGYEVRYTAASAILSFLLWLLTLLTKKIEKRPASQSAELFPSSCGDEPIDLTDRRLYISSAFGTYFASLLERDQLYVDLPGQIDLSCNAGGSGFERLQAIYWALHNPHGPRVFVIAGEGGMGKSTLAARLVRCLFQQDSVDLVLGDSAKTQSIDPVSGEKKQVGSGYSDVDSFLRRLASQLNLFYPSDEVLDTREALKAITDRVAGRRAVLVVDDLQSVSNEAPILDSVQRLVSRDLRVIVTTREITGDQFHTPKVLVIYLRPIESVEAAQKFVKWHIDRYVSVHLGLSAIEPHIQNKELIKRLIQKTGGIPLLMQLVVSDIGRSDWAYIDGLPDLYSSELLEFLYAQRWTSLYDQGELGHGAILLLKFVADCQEKGRRVTHRRLEEWRQAAGIRLVLQDVVRLLGEMFLLVNQDVKRGNYVVFPSLISFLDKQHGCCPNAPRDS